MSDLKILFSSGDRVQTDKGPGVVTGLEYATDSGSVTCTKKYRYDQHGVLREPLRYEVVLDAPDQHLGNTLYFYKKDMYRDEHRMSYKDAVALSRPERLKTLRDILSSAEDGDVSKEFRTIAGDLSSSEVVVSDFEYGVFNQVPRVQGAS